MLRVDPSPSPSSRPGAPGAAPSGVPGPSRLTVASLLAGSAVLLGFDLALAITPRASAALTAVETLLVPAWLAAVVSLERVHKALAGARIQARKPRVALFLLAFVLLLACSGEKWLLLLGWPAEDPG